MGDVVFAARERFDRRPSQPVPAQVQGADRDPAIDHTYTWQRGCDGGLHAILPRAGEHRHLVAAGARERARRLVNVLANAGAGPQRRTIIDYDPHAAEPITTRPYPCCSTGWKDIL